MKITKDLLEDISKKLIYLFQNQSNFANSIKLKDYHGFDKGIIPLLELQKITNKYNISPKEIQAELISVKKDLSNEIHKHKESHAYVNILGNSENVPTPNKAYVFLKDAWFEVKEGEITDIPPNTLHGFTIKPRGTLYFLSVQSPPIKRTDGHDDYYIKKKGGGEEK